MLRRLVFWLLMGAFLWFVIHNLSDIQNVLSVLRLGRWQWIMVAALLQVGYYSLYAVLYQTTFRIVGFPTRFREVFPLVLSSLAINVATPTGGAASTLLFMDHAANKDDSPGKAAAGTSLVFVIFLGVLSIIIFASMIYLYIIDKLERFEIIGTILLMLFILIFALLLWAGLRIPKFFKAFFQFLRRLINSIVHFFGRPDLITEQWVESNTNSFSEAAHAIAHHNEGIKQAAWVAAAMHVVNAISLYVVFFAFQQHISFGNLLAGYAMGMLFWTVSPTPQGIGVVEGVMAVVYNGLGIQKEAATIIALAFRGLAFWIPLLIGFALLRRVKSFAPVSDRPAESLAESQEEQEEKE